MKSVYAPKLLLIVLLSVALVFTDSRQVGACSCGPMTPTDNLRYYTTVFAGRVIDRRTLYNAHASFSVLVSQGYDYDLVETVHTFRVSKIWKGPSYETVYIIAKKSRSSCDFHWFDVGEEYLVYADSDRTVPFCSPSAPLANAQQDLDALGSGRLPEPGTAAPMPRSLDSWYSKEEMVSAATQLLSQLDPSGYPGPPASRSTAAITPTQTPATSKSAPTPTPGQTPVTLATVITPITTPVPVPQPVASVEGVGAPGWLLPAVAGVSGGLGGRARNHTPCATPTRQHLGSGRRAAAFGYLLDLEPAPCLIRRAGFNPAPTRPCNCLMQQEFRSPNARRSRPRSPIAAARRGGVAPASRSGARARRPRRR